jgi:4-amino-4-deoxy-L-arabinose transferase-like glycosyltransferase
MRLRLTNMFSRQTTPTAAQKSLRIPLCVAGLALLFGLYTWGISRNPPGFYLDESMTAYNAYLVSRTGAGEFGPRFPILFQAYAVTNANYINPLTVYLMAIVFRFVHPSIPVARCFAAFWMFAACLLLGVLAKRISGQYKIGIIVAGTALLTPWFVEIGRLVWDAHVSAFTVVLFLLAAYRIQSRETWKWPDIVMVAGSLAVITYGYYSGRVLAPLFALGLLLFATTKHRLLGIAKTWVAYAVTLVPLILFNRSHSGELTNRLWSVSYLRPDAPWKEIPYEFAEFVRRYLEDQNLTGLLITGDYHGRHHVQGSGGPILFATFVLAIIGLGLIIARRWREPWWRFIIYGLAVSIVPGAITNEPFHQLRLMGYAVFLLVLTIPALAWLLAPDGPRQSAYGASDESHSGKSDRAAVLSHGLARSIRLGFVGILLAVTVVQAIDFQVTYRREGPTRLYDFDAPYKPLYDAAVAQPQRPIYLEKGQWGPAYMHAYWYATVEGRPVSEFVRLPDGTKPPSGAIVLSSNSDCQNCQYIQKSYVYLLYRAK